MGEIAEDLVDGTCCCLCGAYFKGKADDELYVHGYPAVCWDCWDGLTKRERKQYQRAQVRTI